MAPTAIHASEIVDISNAGDISKAKGLQSKIVNGHIELEKEVPPPVADNFMYDFKYNHSLPTTDALGAEMPSDTDASQVAESLAAELSTAWSSSNADQFAEMFLDYGVWRDKLVFTWDHRTFNFKENISRAAKDLLPSTPASNIKLIAPYPSIQRPYPDLAFIQFTVSFETEIATGSAISHAVYTTEGWKLWTMHTVIESLKAFPIVDPADGHMTGVTSWESQRAKEDDQVSPEVVVIGGGQNGLQLAAHLKSLGTSTLIIEKNSQIGDIWRNRYEYLSLHLPHWADHFSFFPFPEQWPTYTPAQKLGIFMEWYAHAMELPVWTSSEVIKAEQDDQGQWTLQINKGGNDIRTLHPKHVVMATSLCGVPLMPVIPGLASWKGGVARHSTAHVSARGFKKVLVVGTSSSGFDTAYECARLGVDVTLLQRSPTYVMSLTHSVPRMLGGYAPKDGVRPDIAAQDRAFFAMPVGPGEEMGRRNAETLEKLDKDLLDGLHAKGFKTWRGQRGTGNSTLGQTRNGGFYFEAGACEQIINGNIRVEQGVVEKFTEDKVILSGGREREYDLVVFATGFSNAIDSIRSTLGERVADQCGPIWGIDEEGEFKTAFKETGVPNMWILVGFLASARFHSKLLALRIKALIEGISPSPYKA